MDCSPPGSTVHGIAQARILKWVAFSCSSRSSWPRVWTHVSCTGRWILDHWSTWEALCFGHTAAAAAAAKSLQSCPTLCDPIDGSPPGSPVPGILQTRILEWGAIAFSSNSLSTQNIYDVQYELTQESTVYYGIQTANEIQILPPTRRPQVRHAAPVEVEEQLWFKAPQPNES